MPRIAAENLDHGPCSVLAVNTRFEMAGLPVRSSLQCFGRKRKPTPS